MEHPVTKTYEVSNGIARNKKVPKFFKAIELKQTPKAVYLYGHGTTTETKGVCSICGRDLTHPVSIVLGIGPECGEHYWNWDEIGGYDPSIKERLKKEVKKIKIDAWFPKASIKSQEKDSEPITPPKDHPMLSPLKKEPIKKKAIKVGNIIKITFPYDPETVIKVKTLSGRKWNPTEKYWSCPISIDNIKHLERIGFEMDPELIEKKEINEKGINDLPDIDIPMLEKAYPFQRDGIKFLHYKEGRGLIADEMGLGKTIQAIGYLHANPKAFPTIIVCPASLKYNWQKEIDGWLPTKKEILIANGRKPSTIGKNIDIVIINYDILSDWLANIKKWGPKTAVIDECHYIKNRKTKRTRAVKTLNRMVNHFIALSGTPIENRPIEFYPVISMIEPSLFDSFWSYAKKYCGAKQNRFGWDFTGATNKTELHQKLASSIMIRRQKKDVLKDLPPKTRSIIPIDIKNRKEYNKVERNFIEWLKETKGKEAAIRASNAETLAQIEALKQTVVKGKIDESIKWISDFLESSWEKLVVFCTHKETIKIICDAFPDISVKVDGSVTGEDRQKAVDTFQNDEGTKLFIGNIKAAGVGLTLTASSNVAFLELGWTPGQHDQAEDRVHRIGQEATSINIWYLLGKDTIDIEIAQLIDQKRTVIDAVLDGIETDEDSILTKLIEKYKGE